MNKNIRKVHMLVVGELWGMISQVSENRKAAKLVLHK